jgi:hypothetical protein
MWMVPNLVIGGEVPFGADNHDINIGTALYHVSVNSASEAGALTSLGTEAVLRVRKGYLVLVDPEAASDTTGQMSVDIL